MSCAAQSKSRQVNKFNALKVKKPCLDLQRLTLVTENLSSNIKIYHHFPQKTARRFEHLLDPISGSPARNKNVEGVLCLHVDDLFYAGSELFDELVVSRLSHDYQIGSKTTNDITFTGQHVFWDWTKKCIVVEQDKAIEEL